MGVFFLNVRICIFSSFNLTHEGNPKRLFQRRLKYTFRFCGGRGCGVGTAEWIEPGRVRLPFSTSTRRARALTSPGPREAPSTAVRPVAWRRRRRWRRRAVNRLTVARRSLWCRARRPLLDELTGTPRSSSSSDRRGTGICAARHDRVRPGETRAPQTRDRTLQRTWRNWRPAAAVRAANDGDDGPPWPRPRSGDVRRRTATAVGNVRPRETSAVGGDDDFSGGAGAGGVRVNGPSAIGSVSIRRHDDAPPTIVAPENVSPGTDGRIFRREIESNGLSDHGRRDWNNGGVEGGPWFALQIFGPPP